MTVEIACKAGAGFVHVARAPRRDEEIAGLQGIADGMMGDGRDWEERWPGYRHGAFIASTSVWPEMPSMGFSEAG
jgi:hypothetical protein